MSEFFSVSVIRRTSFRDGLVHNFWCAEDCRESGRNEALMFIEPFFSFLTGMAALAFACAAYLEFVGGYQSARFDTIAAGSSALLLLLHLPSSSFEILLICLITAVAELMVTHGESRHQRTRFRR